MIKANTYDAFFIEALPVPPNRFRPENKMAGILVYVEFI